MDNYQSMHRPNSIVTPHFHEEKKLRLWADGEAIQRSLAFLALSHDSLSWLIIVVFSMSQNSDRGFHTSIANAGDHVLLAVQPRCWHWSKLQTAQPTRDHAHDPGSSVRSCSSASRWSTQGREHNFCESISFMWQRFNNWKHRLCPLWTWLTIAFPPTTGYPTLAFGRIIWPDYIPANVSSVNFGHHDGSSTDCIDEGIWMDKSCTASSER